MGLELDTYRALAPTFSEDWVRLLPEISLGVIALLLLVAELLLPRDRRNILVGLAIWPQVVLIGLVAYSAINFTDPTAFAFNGMIRQTQATEFMRLFFLLNSIVVCYFGAVLLGKQRLPGTEFFHLIIVATAALMILSQAHNFALLFVALETLAICLYVLVSYCRNSPLSLEAGLKYLISSGLSAAILLFGIVLLYGAATNPQLQGATGDAFNFTALQGFISQNPADPIMLTGVILVISGLLFKIAAVPFQIWVSDVYQGAPTAVTAFLAVGSKAAGFVVLIHVLAAPFSALDQVLLPLLQAVAVLTILFGNLAAIGQRNVKRLMGLSGIAHAGYLLLGVCASYYVEWATFAVYFYLFIYMLASLAVFGVMTHLSPAEDASQEIEHYRELIKRDPFLGSVLVIGLGSLAGIPPLAGFAAKLLLFMAAFQAGLYVLLAVAIVGVVISIYYYFRWIREATFAPAIQDAAYEADIQRVSPLPLFWARVIMGALSLLTVIFGFWQAGL